MAQPMKSRRTRLNHRGRVVCVVLAVGGLATLAGGVASLGALTSHATKGVVISTLKTAKFGTILVSGNTVYVLKPKGVGCNTACLKIWPEVLLPKGVTQATAGRGVSASKLGTIRRGGGALQVTYAGKALYWFSYDTAHGQVKGNVPDKWGKWSVVVTVKPANSNPPSTTTTKPVSTTAKPSTTTTKPVTTTTKPPVTTTTASGGGGGVGF